MPTHLEADIEHRNWYLNERKYYQAGIIGSCVNTVPRIPQRYRKLHMYITRLYKQV